MGSKESEKEDASKWVVAMAIAIPVLVVATPIFFELGLPHVYGATPQQLMDEPLSRSPKQLASDLPSTTKSSSGVTVKFKKGAAGDYEKAEYTWDPSRMDAAYSLRLRPEHGEEPPDASSKLSRHFHAFEGGKHRWGPVTIRARDDGDVSFEIDRQVDGKPNPLFARQTEAAKQVVLNAAFDLPLRVSEGEIADVLGAGYTPSAVAKLDPTVPIERAGDALRAAMPATLASGSSTFKVPLDHPLITQVRFSWSNRPHGALDGISLTTSSRYAGNRNTFEACLEKQIGPPVVNVTDYAGGRKDFSFVIGSMTLRLGEGSVDVRTGNVIDAASFSRLFQTLDACREAGETRGGGH